MNLLGKYEFLPGDDLLTSAAAKLCRNEAVNSVLCTNTLFLLAGFNSELFDAVRRKPISRSDRRLNRVFAFSRNCR